MDGDVRYGCCHDEGPGRADVPQHQYKIVCVIIRPGYRDAQALAPTGCKLFGLLIGANEHK